MPYDVLRWKTAHQTTLNSLLHRIDAEFDKSPRFNKWFTSPHASVYIRRTERSFGAAQRYSTIDLSNIEVQQHVRGIGYATNLIEGLERLSNIRGCILFVENVHNSELRRILAKRPNYHAIGHSFVRTIEPALIAGIERINAME